MICVHVDDCMAIGMTQNLLDEFNADEQEVSFNQPRTLPMVTWKLESRSNAILRGKQQPYPNMHISNPSFPISISMM